MLPSQYLQGELCKLLLDRSEIALQMKGKFFAGDLTLAHRKLLRPFGGTQILPDPRLRVEAARWAPRSQRRHGFRYNPGALQSLQGEDP